MFKVIAIISFCIGLAVFSIITSIEMNNANAFLKDRIDKKNKQVNDLVISLNECLNK